MNPMNNNIDKQEYEKLRKERRNTRIIGIILLVVGYASTIIVVAFQNPFLYMLNSFALVGGLVLILRSFVHQKFAPLKNKQPVPVRPEVEQLIKKMNEDRFIVKEGIVPAAHVTDKCYTNNKILGCLLGGAAGDALGYTVEFLQYSQIVEKYGKGGIQSYEYDLSTGKALISDDTQMTLFTAEGLLKAEGDDLNSIYRSYLNWLETQNLAFETRNQHPESSLMNRYELYSRRAPGTTCLSALSSGMMGSVKNPINSSKGCGGIMRVAPIAFLNMYSETDLDKLAVQAAAITHGHPLGYLPAALMVHIIHKSIYENEKNRSLREIVEESLSEFKKVFASAPYMDELTVITTKAIKLSDNRRSDVENINALGEGWVSEETLAIAIYCSLRYANDFSKALVAAVNHNGDSDSTGAVTGYILGAYLGESKIDPKWKKELELYDVISRFAIQFGE